MMLLVRLRLVGALAVLALGAIVPTSAVGQTGELVHLGTDQISPRLQVVHLTTPALGGPTQVRVLLPDGYDPSGATRYPVLYILHGASGNSTRWTEIGGAEAATAGQPLIVVMPDGGLFGFYTDWWNFGAGGTPQWETYHVGQLIPWIDANYPTVASRDGRAIAGESMGGLGAMHYAATRPDLFTAAASFSGAIDTNYFVAPPIVEIATMAEYQHLPAAAFGPRVTEEVRYRGHNPVDLAANLRGLLLQFDVGDGMAGGPGGFGIDPVEFAMHEMGVAMHERLDALGIAHGWNPFPGCHCWTDWQRDLRELVPPLMARFAAPAPAPSPFSYASIRSSYGVYGWDVAIDRPAVEFSRLLDAGPSGFALTGSGAAQVTSAVLFEPGEVVTVTVSDAGGTMSSTITASGDGRLTVPVSLGPGNPFQQYSATGTVWALTTGALPGTWPAVTATVSFEPTVAPAGPTADAAASSGSGSGAPATLAALPATGPGGVPSAALGAAVLALALALLLRVRTRAACREHA